MRNTRGRVDVLRDEIEEEKKNPLSNTPTFPNTAKCLACGKGKFVNTSGFCEKCWITFSHLRKRTEP